MSSDWPIKSETYSALDQATGYLHNRRRIRWPKVRSAGRGVMITSVFLVIQRATLLLKSCYQFQSSALTFNELLLGVGLHTAFFSSNTKLNSEAW